MEESGWKKESPVEDSNFGHALVKSEEKNEE